MKIFRTIAASLLAAFSFVLALTVTATPASAQATRTWVSGVGDDANPCSRTAPCKTFAGAISKTATAGEINCLDPGGFGGLTIVKSISIICDYTEGGVLSAGAGVNGFVINLPSATDNVFLSGLDFNGAGNAQNGIRIVSGGNVVLQNSVIRNYRASNGLGMSIQPAASLLLTITNTTIAHNGTGATGGGMLLQPTGAGGTVRVTLSDVRIEQNSNNGFRADTTGNTGSGIVFVMENVLLNGNTNGISVNAAPATTGVVGLVNNTTINRNTGTGIGITGTVATIRVANSTITDNGTGVSPGTATISSFGDNRLIGNTSNGAFTGAVIPTL